MWCKHRNIMNLLENRVSLEIVKSKFVLLLPAPDSQPQCKHVPFPAGDTCRSTMIGRVAKGRLQIRQIYRLLQWIHIGDKVQIRKMLKLGVQNLINLTEPRDRIGVLHVAVSANNEGTTLMLLAKPGHIYLYLEPNLVQVCFFISWINLNCFIWLHWWI